jgi:hypothetical protein
LREGGRGRRSADKFSFTVVDEGAGGTPIISLTFYEGGCSANKSKIPLSINEEFLITIPITLNQSSGSLKSP